MKIFFIVPLVTHYRETFFAKLINSNPQHEWIIIDGEKKIDDGRPNYYKKFSFPHVRFEETFRKVGPFSLRDYVGLLDFVKKEKPDIVIAPGISGTKVYRDIAKLSRRGEFKLIIWSCLWEHPDVKKHPLIRIKNIVSKKYLKSAAYQIAYSSYAKKKLIEYGYSRDKIEIAYNGIELDGLEDAKIDETWKNDKLKELGIDGKRIFLYVGGLGIDKKVDLLLKAALLLKVDVPQQPFVIIIVGNGPQTKSLKDYVVTNDLDKEIKFLGRIVERVDDYFQLCTCLILPGAGGLSLNQAMYWEKPFIVSHADGTEEDLLIDGITGFKFKQDDPESLKSAMLRCLTTSDETLSKMGREGKELIKHQSNIDKMVETFSKVIDSIYEVREIEI